MSLTKLQFIQLAIVAITLPILLQFIVTIISSISIQFIHLAIVAKACNLYHRIECSAWCAMVANFIAKCAKSNASDIS
jgi:hypothetical protein